MNDDDHDDNFINYKKKEKIVSFSFQRTLSVLCACKNRRTQFN